MPRPFRAGSLVALLLLAGCLGAKSLPDPAQNAPRTLTVTSSAFSEGQPIPRSYSCDGADASPPISIAGVPDGTRALALIMDDPDAPRGTWTHWTFWNLPAARNHLPQGADVTSLGAVQGWTSSGEPGYGGPCPPSGTHRYFFKVYAQDALLNLPAGATLQDFVKALGGHVLAWGQLMGTYSR